MNKLDKDSVLGISALLVHAANIDEIYSDHEKKLVRDFIKSYLKNEDASEYNLSPQLQPSATAMIHLAV